ncbi:hypothetical protein DAQ1742_03981 [Dickeya aquatica]|uniref:Uncharacterized protein n=1 Tax=Dickeya aquatica TaxID=1401087 RepID=A0A375AF84_9GAMM|nr:hypothetical protein DAQ1742_03981 [Dickeya aquatica]
MSLSLTYGRRGASPPALKNHQNVPRCEVKIIFTINHLAHHVF